MSIKKELLKYGVEPTNDYKTNLKLYNHVLDMRFLLSNEDSLKLNNQKVRDNTVKRIAVYIGEDDYFENEYDIIADDLPDRDISLEQFYIMVDSTEESILKKIDEIGGYCHIIHISDSLDTLVTTFETIEEAMEYINMKYEKRPYTYLFNNNTGVYRGHLRKYLRGYDITYNRSDDVDIAIGPFNGNAILSTSLDRYWINRIKPKNSGNGTSVYVMITSYGTIIPISEVKHMNILQYLTKFAIPNNGSQYGADILELILNKEGTEILRIRNKIEKYPAELATKIDDVIYNEFILKYVMSNSTKIVLFELAPVEYYKSLMADTDATFLYNTRSICRDLSLINQEDRTTFYWFMVVNDESFGYVYIDRCKTGLCMKYMSKTTDINLIHGLYLASYQFRYITGNNQTISLSIESLNTKMIQLVNTKWKHTDNTIDNEVEYHVYNI